MKPLKTMAFGAVSLGLLTITMVNTERDIAAHG